MNPEKMLCPCKKVTKGDVLAAMEQGAARFKDVQKMTGCASKCGKCKDDIKKFIRKHRKEE